MKTRVRFAPSPTGHVHIGNVRAAIFNWLFARHTGGQFLLRVEDTDRERSTPEAVRTLLDVMAWLGLDYAEEPLYQSTRTEAHQEAAERLLAAGHAYREDKGSTGRGEAVIFRMPGTDMAFHDEIKGDLRKSADDMRDFVIVRSSGAPVFHLANVVDDIHMGITHVIRGDDHVENTYRHLALFRALGAPPPRYAHLPMIVNAQGKPYSKRDGDAYVGEFRAKGYLPEALFNYLALLGWSPGGDREIMTRQTMSELFDLARVQSSPAQMDLKKLMWMNGEYVKAQPREVFEAECAAVLRQRGLWGAGPDPAYFRRVLEVMGERIKFHRDVAEGAGFFFTEEYPYDEAAVEKRILKPRAQEQLRAARAAFAAAPAFDAVTLEATLRGLAASAGVGLSDWVHPVRVAVSGMAIGPSLFHMLEVLGRERVLSRLQRALRLYPG